MQTSTGAEVRRLARSGEWRSPTPGLAPGYVQANLVCVPRELAFDFLLPRTVAMQKNVRPFQKQIIAQHRIKFCVTYKMIVDAVGFVVPFWTRCMRNRKRNTGA